MPSILTLVFLYPARKENVVNHVEHQNIMLGTIALSTQPHRSYSLEDRCFFMKPLSRSLPIHMNATPMIQVGEIAIFFFRMETTNPIRVRIWRLPKPPKSNSLNSRKKKTKTNGWIPKIPIFERRYILNTIIILVSMLDVGGAIYASV